jgi:hypothetical protein
MSSSLERRQQKKLAALQALEMNWLNRYRWLLSELHVGNKFSKDQLWQWLREANMARDLLVASPMRKAAIAIEALQQLEAIREMLRESGNWDAGGVRYHANSVNNYIRAVQAANMALPTWLEHDRGFLRAHDWRW